MSKQKIYVITGQTATGKTEYALKLAEEVNGEVINADARQIYKHLDIITGKDIGTGVFSKITTLNNEYKIGFYSNISNKYPKVKVWLHDIITPDKVFSLFDYKVCADYIVNHLVRNNKVPIFVGGSYLYLHNYLYQLEQNNTPPNYKLRKKIENYDLLTLQTLLKEKDENLFYSLNNSDKNNPHRLIRKIELCHDSNIKKLGENKLYNFNFRTNLKDKDIKIIGFKFKERENLIHTVKKRVKKRIERGAIEETEKIIYTGYTEKNPGLQTIGYKQIFKYLANKIS
jgi:tRNA dimethylallyltransferase